jgi:mannitol 2-dehydrogenase
VPPNDPSWERLTAQARRAKDDPMAWLEMRDIFGDVAAHPGYVAAFIAAMAALWSLGTRETLARYLDGRL